MDTSFKEIKKDQQKSTKIKPLIEKYNWQRINYLSQKYDKFKKNNLLVAALNILYAKNEKIYPAYVSKHKSNLEKKLFF